MKNYLNDVTNEQLMVGLVPEQASYSSVLSEAEGGFIGDFGGAPRDDRCSSLLAPSDEGDALGCDGLPPAGETVGGDKVGVCYALPG